LVSHYNNQYDFVYGALQHFLRSGDSRWFRLADDLARHVCDIDIYHTGEDKAAYNGGLFWHTDHYCHAGRSTHRTFTRYGMNLQARRSAGGGPSNEHNYTSGLLGYYYVTGDPLARDCVLTLADWVLRMDDGSMTMLSVLNTRPTGYASRTVSNDYHGPGRGAGNSINALLDAYSLSGDRAYMHKAEELIRRCIHPRDDIADLRLDDAEHRWSYLVFLQVLGKYLDLKLDWGETGYCFYFARDSLLHYADWMLDNEVPYRDVLHKVEYPTETWPAQDIRKCHVFHVAAKYASGEKCAAFVERAGFFFERCLGDLLSFDTAYLTRPSVILAVYGPIHGYFSRLGHGDDQKTDIAGSHGYDFGEPQPFVLDLDKARLHAEPLGRRARQRALRRLERSLVKVLAPHGGAADATRDALYELYAEGDPELKSWFDGGRGVGRLLLGLHRLGWRR